MAQKGTCAVKLAPIYERLDDVFGEMARTDAAQKGINRAGNTIDARLAKRRTAFNWVLGAVDDQGKYNTEEVLGRLTGLLRNKVLDDAGSLKKLSPGSLASTPSCPRT